MAASSQFQFAIVPGQDEAGYRGMSIGVGGVPRVVLSKPEMRELFQFLMREARNFEDVCCWHGCRSAGTLYRIRGIAVRAVRFYCDRHATAVELAGFRVFPVETDCVGRGRGGREIRRRGGTAGNGNAPAHNMRITARIGGWKTF